MAKKDQDERLFEHFAAGIDLVPTSLRVPSRLQSRVYSALMVQESMQGKLKSLPATHADGGKLCVFEEMVRIAPVSEDLKSLNICRICHARLLGEMMEKPPIYWGGCPYVSFKKP